MVWINSDVYPKQLMSLVKSFEHTKTFQNKLDFYLPDTIKTFICIN